MLVNTLICQVSTQLSSGNGSLSADILNNLLQQQVLTMTNIDLLGSLQLWIYTCLGQF